ncbi:MAG: 4Fe-4S dicluster domain-containing protein [Planctomycetes bacterium]|nr:4Fe-4S dicluster domain-containing protein [Planctomycetota bacterium]
MDVEVEVEVKAEAKEDARSTVRAIDRDGLERLLGLLREEGYRTIGPTVRDGAIVYDEIESVRDLPAGWKDEQAPGRYRLVRRPDDALFGHVVGPISWKAFLFRPRETLTAAARGEGGALEFRRAPFEPERAAFIGVRSCDLAAIAVQDTVFTGGPYVEPRYAALRRAAFIVAVNCLESGALCFCASMGTGPRARRGFDLALTEIEGRFTVEAGSDAGRRLLERLGAEEARAEDAARVEEGTARCAASMAKRMDPAGLPELLLGNLDHPRWDEVAARCLACANCTMVCPTCFCSTVEETSDLTGSSAGRVRVWGSCFTEEHGKVHGGSYRPEIKDRYRQWLTHKLASWVPQFGTSGCVGCGRCIAWCPVGIDITEEVAAIRASPGPVPDVQGLPLAPVPSPLPAPRAPAASSVEEDLVPRPAAVTAAVRETPDTVTLHVRPPQGFSFRPGQFNMLSLPGVGEVPISISGWDGTAVEHTIRAVGPVTRQLAALRPGQELGMRGPYGSSWPVDEAKGCPAWVVAGGLGLAPLRPLVRELIGRPEDFPEVRLIGGSRTPGDILFVREILGWIGRRNLQTHLTVDRAGPDWRGSIGVVTQLLDDASIEGVYFVCGPEIMMRFAVRRILEAGVPPQRVYVSMERNMKCAAGFCGCCQYGPLFVCKDGPVFRYDSVAYLFERSGF